MTNDKRKAGRPGTGAEMAVLYSRRTKHDSRPKQERTRQESKRAALRDYR